jgi:hypothetical protein
VVSVLVAFAVSVFVDDVLLEDDFVSLLSLVLFVLLVPFWPLLRA